MSSTWSRTGSSSGYRAYAVALLILALTAGAAEPPPLPEAATAFLRSFRTSLHSLLAEEAALDPATGEENAVERQRRLSRLAELTAWVEERRETDGIDGASTIDDLLRLREWRDLRAGATLLTLNTDERRAALAKADQWLDRLVTHGGPALAAMVPGRDRTRTYLAERCRLPLRVEALYLGSAGQTVFSALYQPNARTIYLSLADFVDQPATFADTCEHELWHHLLPGAGPEQIADCPLMEGFIEALAETWAEALHDQHGGWLRRDDPTVEYPVLTAYASLVLAVDRPAVIAWLAGIGTQEQVVAGLARQDGPGAILAAQLRDWDAVPADRQQAIEGLLHGWGWTEDDGSRVTIASMLRDGRIDHEAFNRAYATKGTFGRDTIRAMVVLNLQALRRQAGAPAIRRIANAMPGNLRANALAVLNWSADPTYEFRAP